MFTTAAHMQELFRRASVAQLWDRHRWWEGGDELGQRMQGEPVSE